MKRRFGHVGGSEHVDVVDEVGHQPGGVGVGDMNRQFVSTIPGSIVETRTIFRPSSTRSSLVSWLM